MVSEIKIFSKPIGGSKVASFIKEDSHKRRQGDQNQECQEREHQEEEEEELPRPAMYYGSSFPPRPFAFTSIPSSTSHDEHDQDRDRCPQVQQERRHYDDYEDDEEYDYSDCDDMYSEGKDEEDDDFDEYYGDDEDDDDVIEDKPPFVHKFYHLECDVNTKEVLVEG